MPPIQLSWNTQSGPVEPSVIFVYLGNSKFADLDSHEITRPEHWKNMRAKTPESIAVLQVLNSVTIAELTQAIEILATRAGYKHVRISNVAQH